MSKRSASFFIFIEIGKDPKTKRPIFGLQIKNGTDADDLEEDVHRHAVNLANQGRAVFVVNSDDVYSNKG